jgi:hypothetical protein
MTRWHLALVGACFLLTASVAGAADAKYVKLVHAATGKVLAMDLEGLRVVLGKDGKGLGRQWALEKDGDHYRVVNRKSGKVLDVFNASPDEGAAIVVWDDKGKDNQRWSWEGEGAERRLKSKATGLVLDVDDAGKADDKAGGQLWRVAEVKE